MQLSFYDYIASLVNGKSYSLVERMCKGGFRYPAPPSYANVSKTTGIVAFPSDRLYDTIFLPNIFHYPHGNGIEYERGGRASTLLLAGVRTLQVMQTMEDYQERIQGPIDLTGWKIAEHVRNIFHFHRNMIYTLLVLFSEYEIVESSVSSHTKKSVQRSTFNLLPKGLFILKSMLDRVAYLNMCAMTTPIWVNAAKSKWLHATSTFDCDNINEWASIKIVNASKMFGLLRATNVKERLVIEELEKSGAISAKSQHILDYGRSYGLFFKCFNKDSEGWFNRQISAIYEKMPEDYRMSLYKKIITLKENPKHQF